MVWFLYLDMKTLLLILLFPAFSFGQSLSIAPESFVLWGTTKFTTQLAVEYKGFGTHYFNIRKAQWNQQTNAKTVDQAFAISYRPIRVKYAELGVIVFDRKFPENGSTLFNFYLEAKLPFKYFDVSYVHISNANRAVNHGYDTIKIRFKLNKLWQN